MKLFQNLSTDLAEEAVKSLFLFIALAAILFNVAELFEHGRGSPENHSCIIISKSIFWFRRRSRLKVFLILALAAILFNGAELFEQFWYKGHPRNLPVKLFQNPSGRFGGEDV